MRVGYTRKIFLRHLRSNLSHWSSPLSIARSYFGALENYFCYFMATGMAEAEAGHRLSALRAFWLAFKTFPSRMLRRVATDRAVRGALLLSVFPGGRHHRQDEGRA